MAGEEDKGTATDAAAGAAAEGDQSEFSKAFAQEAAKIDAARIGEAAPEIADKGGAIVEAPVGDEAKDITPAADATEADAGTTAKPKGKRQQARDEEFEHFLETASPEQLRESLARTRTDLRGKAQAIANDRSTIAELRQKMADAEAARRGADTTTAAAEGGDTTASSADKRSALLGPKFEELKATYPEVAGPLEEIATTIESRHQQTEGTLAEIREDRQKAVVVEQTNKLLEGHPYFPEMRDTDEFKTFLFENQDDPTLGPIIKANVAGISNARDVSRLVSVFVAESGYEPPPKPAPGKTAAEAEPGASETQDARRKAQLRSGTAVNGKGSGPTSTPADDFKSAFAFEAAKTEKEMRAAGRL